MRLSFICLFQALLLAAALHAERPMRVLVYPFENQGAAAFSWLSAGMTDSVIADLGCIRSIEVITDADRKKALKEMEFELSGLADEKTAARIGKFAGADTIFTGSYTVAGGRVRVVAKLMNVESGSLVKSVKLDGTVEYIFDLQDKIVFALMDESQSIIVADVGRMAVTNEEKSLIQKKQRPSLSAYEYYAKAVEMQDTDPLQALRLFNESLAIDPGYAAALTAAGFTAGNTLNRFEDALGFLDKAAVLMKQRGQTETADFARLKLFTGVMYYRKGNYERYLEHLVEAKAIFDRIGLGNASDYARLMMNFGNAYGSKRDWSRSLDYYLLADGIYKRIGMTNTTAYSGLLINIGNLYDKKGEQEKSLGYYNESKGILDRLGMQNASIYALLMDCFGSHYIKKGDYNRALEHLGKSRDAYDRLGMQNTAVYSGMLFDAGYAYLSKGEPDRALECFERSREIDDRLGMRDTTHYADLLMNMGHAYRSKGDTDKALEHLGKSRDIYDRLKLQKTTSYGNILFGLASLYETKGQRDEAGKLYRKAYETYQGAGYTGEWKEKARQNAERLGN